jgi:hypothetical protein
MINDKAFEQLSQYAALVQDDRPDEAAGLRRAIMEEHGADGIGWLYMRDAWVQLVRGRISNLLDESTAMTLQSGKYDDEAYRKNDKECSALRRLLGEREFRPEMSKAEQEEFFANFQPKPMAFDDKAFLLDAIRSPRVLRSDLSRALSLAFSDALSPKEEASSGGADVLIRVLKPMLRRTIKDFFATPKAERGKYKGPRLDYDPEPRELQEEAEEEDQEAENLPVSDPYARLVARFDKMKDGEWQQLAADLVERPEVLIGDPAAVLALLRVIEGVASPNPLRPHELHILNAIWGGNAKFSLLPVLLDMQRTVGV